MSDSDVVIRVEGLGKKYALNHEKSERYTALRDVVARQAKAAGRLLNPFTLAGQLRKAQCVVAVERAESEEEFWALKDVSFEIRRGERVGIIGRNGAGKSTLLKILSRITEPTTGRVEIRGRVASLLEVGTGFHPELTGRENIYLNGAVLGMTKKEIDSRFKEIVEFAEVRKFLDTPVKRYSSGMYVRLAFSVAAHLESEILIVDEVLAVGDSMFQEKCLERMSKVSSEQSKTLLLVSHNISAIEHLCNKTLVVESGMCKGTTEAQSGIAEYKRLTTLSPILAKDKRKPDTAGTTLLQAWTEDKRGLQTEHFEIQDDIRICAIFKIGEKHTKRIVQPGFAISDENGHRLATVNGYIVKPSHHYSKDSGTMKAVLCISKPLFAPGTYIVDLSLAETPSHMVEFFARSTFFKVVQGDFYGSGQMPSDRQGRMLLNCSITIE